MSRVTLPKNLGVAKNLRVLHVGKFYPPHMGGIETHLQDLCGKLNTSIKLQVLVASNDASASEETVDGVPVSRIPTWLQFSSAPICPGMVSRIRSCRSDIVHLHIPNPTAVLAFLASGHKGRLVVTYHSDMVRQRYLGPLFEPFLHAVLRRSDAIITTSVNYMKSSRVLARHNDRCHVIPLGIALEKFAKADSAAVLEVRRRFGGRLIVSVGRLVSYKGFEYLIRAMGQVNGSLLIVGEGPLRSSLVDLARDLGVADRVHFLGKVDHDRLVACYHAANIFALGSILRSEAFGIVQVEAMAAGLPVVNTNLDSGVPFVSIDGETGLTVPPADPSALAQAFNRLLDNPDLQRSLGAAARRRALQEFGLDVMAARTLAVYQAVMAPAK